jgi:hypothetical protein
MCPLVGIKGYEGSSVERTPDYLTNSPIHIFRNFVVFCVPIPITSLERATLATQFEATHFEVIPGPRHVNPGYADPCDVQRGQRSRCHLQRAQLR